MDSYCVVVSNHLALEAEGPVDAETVQEAAAEDPHVFDLKRAVETEVESLPQSPKISSSPAGNHSSVPSPALTLCALLSLGCFIYLLKRKFNSLISAPDLTEQRLGALLEKNSSVETFFKELEDAGRSSQAANLFAAVDPQTTEEQPIVASNSLQNFFASAPGQLANLRKLVLDFSRASDVPAYGNILVDFLRQVGALKGSSTDLPELHAGRLMACTLEGFLKQLSYNPAQVSHSALRTIAGAVDLLERLCVPGLNPKFAADPPIRILAVDDDPVNHLAITLALKRTFIPPDVAGDGKAALALAAGQNYDVIFLDVDMPGMDGLELCTRIHQMERHRKTPIVFVTQYDDINTRARSALSGGESLIAKPFMAFEIAVKALTLALRSRLQKDVTATYSTGAEDTQTQVGNATEAPAALLLHSLQQENRLPLEWNGRTAEKTFQRRDIITAKQARSLCSDQSVPGRLSPSILQKLSASADEP